jgi:hypothetical protein
MSCLGTFPHTEESSRDVRVRLQPQKFCILWYIHRITITELFFFQHIIQTVN